VKAFIYVILDIVRCVKTKYGNTKYIEKFEPNYSHLSMSEAVPLRKY
jgi:hypothetical protein